MGAGPQVSPCCWHMAGDIHRWLAREEVTASRTHGCQSRQAPTGVGTPQGQDRGRNPRRGSGPHPTPPISLWTLGQLLPARRWGHAAVPARDAVCRWHLGRLCPLPHPGCPLPHPGPPKASKTPSSPPRLLRGPPRGRAPPRRGAGGGGPWGQRALRVHTCIGWGPHCPTAAARPRL